MPKLETTAERRSKQFLDIGAKIFLAEGPNAPSARRIAKEAKCDDKLVSYYLGKQDERQEKIKAHVSKLKRRKAQ